MIFKTNNIDNIWIEEGNLKISVFEKNYGKPAKNATVQIKKKNDNSKIIEELITNNLGQ